MLADDQAMVRGALAALLALERDIEVVAQVGSGDDVLPAALEHRPDVVLMDVDMPGTDGLSATAQLLRRLPGIRVLVVTTFGRPGFLRRAIQSGAHGFVVKDARPPSWPSRCGGCTPGCASLTPPWPRTPWSWATPP